MKAAAGQCACLLLLIILPGCGAAPDPYAEFAFAQNGNLKFHFSPDLQADKPALIAGYRKAYDRIVATLGITWEKDIDVYMFANDGEGERLTGRPLAYAQSSTLCIYTAPLHSDGHELCHILASALPAAAGRNQILDEGLAQFLNGRGDDKSYVAAMELLSGLIDKKPFTEGEFLPYCTRASLVEYLINLQGMEKFKQLWGYERMVAGLPAVYGNDLAQIEEQWTAFLAGKIGEDPAIFRQQWQVDESSDSLSLHNIFVQALDQRDSQLVTPGMIGYYADIFPILTQQGFSGATYLPETVFRLNHKWLKLVLFNQGNRAQKLILIFAGGERRYRLAGMLWPPGEGAIVDN